MSCWKLAIIKITHKTILIKAKTFKSITVQNMRWMHSFSIWIDKGQYVSKKKNRFTFCFEVRSLNLSFHSDHCEFRSLYCFLDWILSRHTLGYTSQHHHLLRPTSYFSDTVAGNPFTLEHIISFSFSSYSSFSWMRTEAEIHKYTLHIFWFLAGKCLLFVLPSTDYALL